MKKVKFSQKVLSVSKQHNAHSFDTFLFFELANGAKIKINTDDLSDFDHRNLVSIDAHYFAEKFYTEYEDDTFTFSARAQENEKPAEKVTPEHVESIIVKEEYLTPTDTLTICVLTLKNGASVTGESACADPKLFDKALGEKYARENAFDKAWAFEGYLLKERLFNGS